MVKECGNRGVQYTEAALAFERRSGRRRNMSKIATAGCVCLGMILYVGCGGPGSEQPPAQRAEVTDTEPKDLAQKGRWLAERMIAARKEGREAEVQRYLKRVTQVASTLDARALQDFVNGYKSAGPGVSVEGRAQEGTLTFLIDVDL